AGNIQQLSPSAQSTTTALSLLNAEPQAGNNTIKLTSQVKIVKVPVAPGQYVTGLLPIQQPEVANPDSNLPEKRQSVFSKALLVLLLIAFVVGGIGGGIALLRSRGANNTASQTTPGGTTSAASLQATATAQANILFSDRLDQN